MAVRLSGVRVMTVTQIHATSGAWLTVVFVVAVVVTVVVVAWIIRWGRNR